MNQTEYLNELKRCLSSLSRDERNRVVEYYAELIGDKIESGIPEQEVLSQLGTPRELSMKILSESSDYKDKHSCGKSNKLSVGRIIGFSILMPFVIIALAVLYTLAISFACAAVGLVLVSVIQIFGVFFVMAGSFAAGLYQLGFIMFAFMCGVFVTYGSWNFIRLCIKITVNIFKAYKKTYVKEAVNI